MVCSTSPFFSQHLRLIYSLFSISNRELTLIQTLLSLSGVLAAIITSLYAIRQMKQARASIPSLNDYVKKGEDGELQIRSDLAAIIDAFGSRIAKSLRMSFLQGLGAEAKVEKGLQGAMISDAVESKLPLLSLLDEFAGINTKKYLTKHPEAIGQLIQLAGPLLKGGNDGSPQSVNWKDPFV